MKALLPLLIVLLLSASAISAQEETPESTDWTTEERCITAPSQPPEGWTYDGVIFTFKPGDGVHARRADVATPYYVAFDSEDEYAWAGSFSPDGRWFALPSGIQVDEHTTSLDNQYWIDELHIYSTSPVRQMSRFRLHYHVATYGTEVGMAPQWIDNQHILYPTGSYVGLPSLNWVVVDPFSGEITPYNGVMPPSLEQRIVKFGLPSDFVQIVPAGIMRYYPQTISFSADNEHFAFIKPGLQIGDVTTRQIIDPCIYPEFSQVAFSPDGRQLAFGLEPAGYVYILDIEAWEAYRIDLAAADVIGWYPVE